MPGIALVGCGIISPYLLKGLAQIGQPLAVACDIDADRAQEAADTAGGTITTDIEQVLSDSAIDAVLIALPTYLHAQTVSRCLAAGKHVFCEKPLGLHPTESLDLVHQARASGRILQVGYMKRFHPAFGKIKPALSKLGQLYHACVQLTIGGKGPADSPPQQQSASWHGIPEKAGGGFLVHSGSHLVDLIIFTFGLIRQVTGSVIRDAAGNESKGDFLLTTESGVTVHLLLARTRLQQTNRKGTKWQETVQVVGSNGRITAEGFDWTGMESASYIHEQTENQVTEHTDLPSATQWGNQMRAFIDAVQSGAPHGATGEEAYRVDVVLNELRQMNETVTTHTINYQL